MRRKHHASEDELQGIAGRLRSERPQASPLELDRIKTAAMSRARAAATGRRAPARRLAVAGLTAGLLLATTGGVLAGQGGGGQSPGNAAVAQYGSYCDVGNGNGSGNSVGANSNGNSNNGNNNYNCNENSFNNTTINNTTNNTTNNYGGTNVVNNYTTIAAPSGGVLGSSTAKPTTSDRHIKIHVKIPRGARVRRVTVKVNGKRLKTVRGKKASANVELENLPCGKGATTVVVTVTLSNGKTVTARHTYHLCT